MTIAEKHLSKHGRFGDTEIVSTSSGELWHVNKFEKKLMDDYGVVGERLVDIYGAGTINPSTGLKEQYIQAIAAVGSLALGAYQGYKQSKMEKASAKEKKKLAQQQLSKLDETESLLSEQVQSQMNLLQEESEMQKEQLTDQLEEINEGISNTKGKVGFAYSGDVENQEKDAIEGVRDREEGLMATYGSKVGEVMGMFNSEKARIKAERARLDAEINLYNKML